LPTNWPTGELRGVRTRGGVELDFRWDDGEVRWLRMRSTTNRDITVHASNTITLSALANEAVQHEFSASQ
jgi:alpha-L-fucosidase 2